MATTSMPSTVKSAALRPATPPRARFRWNWSIGLIVPVALVVAWQLAKSLGALPYENIPSPAQIGNAAVQLAVGGELGGNLGHTLVACLVGWAIGSAIGVVLGTALGLSRWAWTYSMASVDVLRAIPAIAFIPIVVIVFAQTLQMEIVITLWVSIWPVAVSTMSGVAGVSPAHDELAASLRMPWLRRVTKLALPTAAPKILIALRLSLSGAFALAIVAEIVGNPAGIGYALVNAQQQLRPDVMFAYILLTGALGLALNAVITLIFRLLAPGYHQLQTRGGTDGR
jgi:ABC-type nitrate/sulfonate/bicarbonate transport system permease component